MKQKHQIKQFSVFMAVLLLLIGSACQKQEAEQEDTSTLEEEKPKVFLGYGPLCGEVRQHSVILQARLSSTDTAIEKPGHWFNRYAYPAAEGVLGFILAKDSAFTKGGQKIEPTPAKASDDAIVKAAIRDLEPGTAYFYKVIYGTSSDQVDTTEAIYKFKTLQAKNAQNPTRFALSSCMHFERYREGLTGNDRFEDRDLSEIYTEKDEELGMPGFVEILKHKPDFWIANGDNVYYDHIYEAADYYISTRDSMRLIWHQQFSMPRLQKLFQRIPVYWMKDDHDFRYDDGDTTNRNKGGIHPYPTVEWGIQTFRNQVPITYPDEEDAVTYRTYRLNDAVQIWMIEGRDYRSPNDMEPGPEKTLWGEKQKAWIKKTLQESDAAYKLFISPTPMVGPDDMKKQDNHTNPKGFKHEGDAFFAWAKEQGFKDKGLYFFCGDRHWQYHSIHPTGFHEFACGTLISNTSRIGREPGEEGSTDPNGLITQPYLQEPPVGGFILFDQYYEEAQPKLDLHWISEFGDTLYSYSPKAAQL